MLGWLRGGLGDDEIDVAVFRFTLGIPGFDDRLVPRVVGGVIGALLLLNHVLGADPAPEAQLRSEWLGVLLAAVCALVPDIEERLREAMPGRGRAKAAEAVEGATNCFFLEASLPEAAKKELAWSSFSLLKNTNSCGVLLAAGGRVLMARGAMGASVVTPGDAAATLAAMSRDVSSASSASSPLAAVAGGSSPQLWLPERPLGSPGAAGTGLGGLASVPGGAQCLVAQHVAAAGGGPALLVVFSERPRALSERERLWVAAVAEKLAPFV
ncbi:hypothetical protein GPECTOR_384g189 [Gonium pectorale]|uniref:Uncharacterized protein n=1 Tax=Gonium pectorale TaxID=33097 RepID=A0A150FVC4_GONPE|nr:hypothetical protein GPECTOR_384g189 [Gonium pectorale]|eukprot:KXZ41573.1 hypothetical protein GPECTOR_384g189 [Gonium pectorale]